MVEDPAPNNTKFPNDVTFHERSRIVGEILQVDNPDDTEEVVEELVKKLIYFHPETGEPYSEDEIDANIIRVLDVLNSTLKQIHDVPISPNAKIDMLEAWMTVATKFEKMTAERAARPTEEN